MSILWYVLAILALLCGSAFFSASEMALSSANRLRLENAAEEGDRGAKTAVALLDRYEDALSAILIGNNLCNIGSDTLVTVLAMLLLGRRYTGLVSALITAFMVLVVIFLCESAPKISAKKNANRWAVSFAPFLRLLSILLLPLVRLTGLLIKIVTLPVKEDIPEEDEDAAAEELQSILETVEDEGVIDEDRSEMVQAALDFSDIPVMDVMTARVDMEAIDIDDDPEEIFRTVEETDYSRLPVYEGSADDMIGILYLNRYYKALLDGETPDLRSLLFKPLYIYKTVKLPAVLNELRRSQQHMAIVTDEYGGTLGIVTLEDVLEQIVGEIWDEKDDPEKDVVERPDGIFELDGDLPLGDVAELLDMPEEDLAEADSATVGGWTIEKQGRFPKAGETVEADGLRVKVLAMSEDGLRVERVLAERLTEEKDEE